MATAHRIVTGHGLPLVLWALCGQCTGQTADGPAIGWGPSAYYRAIENSSQNPPPIPSGRFKSVSAGYKFTLYLTSSSDPKEDGVILFRGIEDSTAVPEEGMLRDYVPEGTGYKAVAGGFNHCLAIDASDHLRAWGLAIEGNNYAGQVPSGLASVAVSAIVAGEGLSAAIRADSGHVGEIVTWGASEAHAASTPYETLIAPGSVTQFTEISAAGHHLVARTINGDLFAWGAQSSDPYNVPYDQGQVGFFNQTPRHPSTNAAWGPFAAGHWHTVALDADGVWYEPNPTNPTGAKWGGNGCGQGTSSCSTSFPYCMRTYRTPPCSLPTFTKIEGGYFHNTGRTMYGGLIIWGGGPTNPAAPYRINTFSAKFDHGIGIQSCYANCDGSTTSPFLNINDYSCFINSYANGDPTADCNGSGTLTTDDYTCFQGKYTAGCSAP